MNSNPIYPRPLSKGDTIAIVSPASIIDPALVDGASRRLEHEGYRVVTGRHALGVVGSFSGSADDRFADLADALTDRSVRAILCSRGGYGCVHLLDRLSSIDVETDPKWLIGFSDVSALHSFMASRGIVSVHGSMAKALAQNRIEPNNRLLSILRGQKPGIEFPSHQFNRTGTATGRLTGGNLAVIQALINTPYDTFRSGTILFIEDIAEPIYKIERILYQLHLSGILSRLSGLIIGQFTDYRPSNDHPDMNTMIDRFLSSAGKDLSIPIAFDAPIGHIEDNLPVLHNSLATLTVTEASSTISYL